MRVTRIFLKVIPLTFVEHENFAREKQGVLSEEDVMELIMRLLVDGNSRRS